MWKSEHRVAADRRGLRYPSDLIDAEWALVSSLIPPARRGGRKRSVDVREVLNAIFYVLATGCQWKRCRKICRPRAPRISISCCGIGMARSGNVWKSHCNCRDVYASIKRWWQRLPCGVELSD
jgi:transposase